LNRELSRERSQKLTFQVAAKITIAMYGLNHFDRPKARSDYYKWLKNQIRKQKIKINQDKESLSYRFMFF